MSEPFLAEIKIVGFNFAPRGWAFCDGQILPINQNQSLFSLLGTTYGGDGRTSFALPDLRSRTPIHKGEGHNLGSKTGAETVALTEPEIPQHTHKARASADVGGSASATGMVLAATGGGRRPLIPYAGNTSPQALFSGSLANTGAGQGHENMQPFLTLNFVIALQGLFPSRN